MTYTWLFFDADGTLFDYEAAEAQALEATLAEFGIPFQAGYLSIYQTVNQRMWQLFETGQISSIKLRVQRFEEFLASAQINADAGVLSESYLPNLARSTDLIPGAAEVVQSLAPHYHLALITNGLTSVQKPRLAASVLAGVFQTVIISEEIGVAKPAPEYFQMAMRLSGASSPREALVIGDSLSSDIRGANLAGIDACWFNPSGQPLPPGYTTRYQISRLSQLLDFL